jgi:GNAT superfamily N-acetyltransferase
VFASLRYFAEDPEFFLEPPEGSTRIADDRFCVVIGSERRWAGVCRLRLRDEPSAIKRVVDEILDLVQGIKTVVWNVGSSAEPEDLPERLLALGLREPDPPLDAVVAAMTLAEAPAAVDGVEILRIETLDDHIVGLEIMLAADTWSAEAISTERARATKTFERRMRRGGMQWLAYVDGMPVAWASAERASVGLYLAGGATAPEARGRGCYRALVRARWDEAVRLGIPGLAVQAQYGSSAPILRGLGFVEVATIHTLQS